VMPVPVAEHHASLLSADQLYFRGLYLEKNRRMREAIAVLEEASQKPGPPMEKSGRSGPPMEVFQRKALRNLPQST